MKLLKSSFAALAGLALVFALSACDSIEVEHEVEYDDDDDRGAYHTGGYHRTERYSRHEDLRAGGGGYYRQEYQRHADDEDYDDED